MALPSSAAGALQLYAAMIPNIWDGQILYGHIYADWQSATVYNNATKERIALNIVVPLSLSLLAVPFSTSATEADVAV